MFSTHEWLRAVSSVMNEPTQNLETTQLIFWPGKHDMDQRNAGKLFRGLHQPAACRGMHCSSVGDQLNLTPAPRFVTRTFKGMSVASIGLRKYETFGFH